MKTTENIRIRTHCSNLTVAAPAALSATNALAGKWKANNPFLEPRRRVPHPRSVLSMLLSLGVFLALESPALAAIATPTTTTLGMTTSPQVYGSTVLSASVVASDLTPVSGNVTFKDSGIVVGTVPVIGGTASLPTKLAVNGGAPHPIQAQFSDPAVVYASSISGVSNVVITARGITVSGSKTYDGGTTVAAGNLSINNNVDGPNLTLSGTAVIAGRNAGPEAILSATYAAPARVQVASGNSGSNAATSFTATLGRAPTNGNTLVAVIATRGTTNNTITSISQANVTTWKRAVQAANPGNNASGVTTEIWYAPIGASAGTAVTINQTAALRSAAIVLEYSGVLTSAAVDQTANGTGFGTNAVTGTTPSTTLGNELWIGGIGLTNSAQTLGSVLNSFNSVTNAQSTYFSVTFNSKVYALEKIVSGTGTANSGGTISGPATWAGAIATFYGVPGLSLGGAAAANYTVAGVSGTVAVNPTNLTVTAVSNTKPYDGGTSATGTPTITAGGLQTGDTTTAFTETYDNKNVGTGKTLTPAGVVNDGNSGLNYNYTYAQNFTGVITALQIAPSGQPTNLAVCAGSPAIFSVVVPGVGLTHQWQMSGDGGTTFTNISDTATNACYTNVAPTLADGNGLQYQVIVSGAGTPSVTSTQAVLTVNAPATASAGGNQTICAGNDTAALGGTVGGGATGGTWTSSGTGDFNPDATTLNATYTPSMDDLTGTGTVTLTLTTTGQQAPCGAATASVVVTIHAQATVGSGGNQTICAGQSTAALGGFVYGSATNGIWTSSGGGTFTPNATAMNAIYTPSAADISAGAATLTLTTTDQPAFCSPAAVQMVVTIHPAAQVNAGPNQTVCSSSPAATLAGSYGGTATSASWSGAGTFAPNSTAMSAIYTPTAGEITVGHATVTLTSNDPSGPCPAVSATMTITIAQAATASAGGNQTIYADQVTAGLGGTVGGGATGGTWTSSGTGTFAPNASALGAVYHPSAADKTAQTVTLTLTTTGQLTPCTPTTAHLVVTIHALPAITAEPANVTVCAGSSAIFTVTATGAGLTYEWLVSFDFGGSWGDISATATNASYTNPATSLIADDGTLYQVIVSSPWGLSVTSAPPATLTVNEPATVEAGPNQTVCASSLATTLAGSFGGGTTSATWSGAGRFTPNNATLNAVYTPTAGEIAAGTATVTLTTDDPPGPCGPASASMTITINPAATVSGGPSQTVCSSSPATQLAGSFGGAATGAHWSGAGTFVPNIYVLTPVYTPTAAEIAAGHATVTLTTDDPPGPCPPVSVTMTITIYTGPATANAGPNQWLCLTNPTVQLAGSVGGGATGGTWSTECSGTFTPDARTLNAVFNPSLAAISNGCCTLTLTSDANPCGAATSTMICCFVQEIVLTCVSNKTVPRGAAWSFDAPTVVDPCCGPDFTLTFSTVTNGNCCSTAFTRTWQGTDCSNRTATCSQTVTVVDTTAPVLTNCNDIVTTATAGMNGAVVLYNVTATDVCQTNVLLVCTPPSGSFFPCGTNVVVCTATDSCGNSSTCSFKVVVLCPCVGVGNEQLTCVSNAPGQLSYSFDLQNNTGLPVNYLLLVPNTNCFTFTPDIITFRPPLPPGQTTNVSAMIHLAGPCASNLCFTLLAQGSSECCYITHCVDRTAGPRLVSAVPNCGGNKITVTFSEPLDPATVLGAPNFIVADLTHQMSLAFASTTFGADFKTVWLFTVGTLSAGTQYQLTVNNVSDTCGNVIAPNSRLTFSCPDAGHRLICTFVNGQFCLSWCCDGVLEFTPALTPPINWAPTPNQSNPQCFPPGGGQKFFRLRQ